MQISILKILLDTIFFLGGLVYRKTNLGKVPRLKIPGRVTVILLNYKRPQNIDPIVRRILKCEFVEKVIISNNNPHIPSSGLVRERDSRIAIVSQLVPTRGDIRWKLALDSGAENILLIDDDVFFYPRQIATLIKFLLEDPSSPHGFAGSIVDKGRGPDKSSRYAIGRETEVDVLHQAYAVTREHILEYFRLSRELSDQGQFDGHAISMSEDVIISQSGTRRPRIHNIGVVFECITAHQAGIAIHKTEPDFDQLRKEVYKKLVSSRIQETLED